MEKEKLRPVEVTKESIFEHEALPKNTKGYFHRYVTTKDPHHEETHALIELENGEMHKIFPTWIKFLDRV